ncbi:S1C family serine protease [Terrabacter sp. Ter38]|uniref:S1C family serine protease n=1 Tax=Terrabacter sp. Ter38 TaxID=2926030 RepID=UPI002118A876|nr:trypsin-like peptidase domain-containing protein [Terrabacter sp. Ter38]
MIAVVLLVALLAGGAALAGTLRSGGDTSAAPPTPSATVVLPPAPTPSSSPSQPTPSAPQRSAPASPPGVVPGSPPNAAQQPETLTPQQEAAAAAVSKGLVDVNTSIGSDGSQGAGTGIVLSADGLVLTNHHVVAGATAIRATDAGNGQTYDATVLGYDSTHDVAVLRLKGASGLTVAPLGSSSTVHVGDAVVAVGNAGGAGGTPSSVAGTVSAVGQPITVRDETDGSDHTLTDLIQFEAAIQPGDSGGALVDAASKVVGVVTAGSAAAASTDVSAATDGFAIPIDQARSIAQQIIEGKGSETVHIGATGYLGIQVTPGGRNGSSRPGVPVGAVVPGSPAAQAGIRRGDVITAVGGRTVTSTGELHAAVSAHRPGDTVSVSWTDAAGQNHTASIGLGTGPVG